MADDIDDLLDEVESSFAIDKQKDKKNNKSKLSRKRPDDDEINNIIDDICGDTEPLEKCNKVQSVQRQVSVSKPVSPKCFPLSIGGTSVEVGCGTSVNKRACDKMRCTACDFRVVLFNDYIWDPSTDYLFLRNNAPDFDRLESKLSSKRGYRAYCCQCCHTSTNRLVPVKDLQVKWVCGSHE